MANEQKKGGIWAVVIPYLIQYGPQLFDAIFHHKHKTDAHKSMEDYLNSLDEDTRKFVISEMMATELKIVKPQSECSNPCTGQGSTPYGHWTHDAQCRCVWVPEFGRPA